MLSLFPRAVLDEIWDLIGSEIWDLIWTVSGGFPTYFFMSCINNINLKNMNILLIMSCLLSQHILIFYKLLRLFHSLSPFCLKLMFIFSSYHYKLIHVYVAHHHKEY